MSFWSKLFGKKKKPVQEAVEPVVEKVEEPVVEEPVVEVVKEEPVVQEEPQEETPNVVEEKVEEPQEETPVEEAPEDIYEVRVHKEEGWQVIKKGGKRATRRFPTQSGCIEFCKENGFKYEVYKKDGTLR